MSTKPTNKRPKKLELFEVWKEYEHIAMHFNELLMHLRMRALGGVAAISALVGILSKGETAADFRWGIVAAVLFVLAFVWVAIWIIDAKYYTRLLLGAVRAVLEVEKSSLNTKTVHSLQLSHRIKETVEGDFSNLDRNPIWKDAVCWFYALVLAALLSGTYFSLGQHCTSATDTSFARGHGLCHIVSTRHKTSP